MDADAAPKRTSLTHPIDVLWVDTAAFGGPGRLGLSYAPGKKGRAPASGIEWDRDLTADLERLAEVHRVDVLVSLMEPFEYEELGIPDMLHEVAQRGIEVVHLPIVDGQAPQPEQAQAVKTVLANARGALSAGRNVVIHCRGGQGRTGMLAAALLATYGHDAHAAIDIVRAAQPRAVESQVQQAYVESVALDSARSGPAAR